MIGGLATLGLAAAALWFFENYEQVETQVWVGPSSAARANPYLAAQRFIERMGYAVGTIDRPGDLDAAPPGATLILPARRAMVTPARAQTLLGWAEAGGHLIVEPEPSRSRDPLLDALGIGRRVAENIKPAATMAVELPGLERVLDVTPTVIDTLELAAVRADWTAADANGIRLASLRRGSGRISIVTGLQRFGNRAIGAHDNAELLWRMLGFAPDHRTVLILRPPRRAPLIAWAGEHAAAVVVSGLGLLALWLWRLAPRFGPLAQPPEPGRRQLLEHIRACGRFRWAQGARESLLGAAREICQARIARLRPRIAVLPVADRYRELAAEMRIGADRIADAFEGAPRAGRDFVRAVATLASIHAVLSRAQRTARPAKRAR